MDDYPLLDIFFTMLWFYVIIAWFWFLIVLMTDILRNRELSGVKKAAWAILLIFLPVITALLYLMNHGNSMHERQVQDSRRGYFPNGAAGASTADELTKLAALRDSGTLTDAEFETQKAKVLSA